MHINLEGEFGEATVDERGNGRRGRRRAMACAVALLPALGLAGCGEAARGPVVVRVGGSSISKRTLDHWSAAIAHGAAVASPSSSPSESAREQALNFLISSRWLLGEAALRGAKLSERQLGRMLEERVESNPGGRGEFQKMLGTSGQTLADARFELKVRWAATMLERRTQVLASALARARVSAAETAAYYRAHLERYRHRERRDYDLIERIKSAAAAREIAKRLGSGRRFAEAAVKESPSRPSRFDAPNGKGDVFRAVFAAKVGVIVGPIKLDHRYSLFVLRHIAPARVQPLSEVRGAIEARLYAVHRREALAGLLEAFTQRWSARTYCLRGYVVQKCRQYTGTKLAEGDPFAGY
jgi:hypothetical protein